MTLLPLTLSLILFTLLWLFARATADRIAMGPVIGFGAMTGVTLAASQIWPLIGAGYPNDSYWTLGAFGRAGVIAISASGLAAMFALLSWKSQMALRYPSPAALLLDTGAGVLIFAVIYSVSPQAFYALYRVVIPGLPQQWVIDGIIDLDRLITITQLRADGNLSDHLAGLALWAIVPMTLIIHLSAWWRKRQIS